MRSVRSREAKKPWHPACHGWRVTLFTVPVPRRSPLRIPYRQSDSQLERIVAISAKQSGIRMQKRSQEPNLRANVAHPFPLPQKRRERWCNHAAFLLMIQIHYRLITSFFRSQIQCQLITIGERSKGKAFRPASEVVRVISNPCLRCPISAIFML